MLALLRQNYLTYVDQRTGRLENQPLRLFLVAVISIFLALFAPPSSGQVYSMMATGITVLTGFTFTALFSDHALAAAGLPKPKSESDRQDLRTLKVLASNFRARSSYFIAVSILTIFLLALISFEFSVPKSISAWVGKMSGEPSSFLDGVVGLASDILPILARVLLALVIFIYLECLYTFYRLAETILAILDTRRSYLNLENDTL